MSAKVALPILAEAKVQGNDVAIVAEGRATTICEESGLVLLIRGTDELQQFGHSQVSQVLNDYVPDVLLIGLSAPINWELEFAQVARGFKVPVVAIEDIWGGLTRLNGFVPDLALVMDSLAKRLAESYKRVLNCEIIGDIASTIKPVIPENKLGEAGRMRTLHDEGKKIILIVGDHTQNVLEIVDLVTASVRLEPNPSNFVVTHSLVHPKLVGTPEGDAILEPATRLLKGLRVEQFGGLSTDARAARAHYTATCFSTPLRIALHHGQRAISVMGPISKALLKKETGTHSYPLAASGVVPALIEPSMFDAFLWSAHDRLRRNWIEESRFQPAKAIAAISRFIES